MHPVAASLYNGRMTRSSASFRRMACLALMAVLLSIVAPTASRVIAATASKAAPILMELCTTAGRQMLDVSPFIALEETPAQPSMETVDACGYCVLATPLPLVLLLFCLLALLPVRPPVVRYYLALLRSSRNTRGLGSQAPPLAL
jgi:hypothetical protein